jgi:hypothetical protein
LPRAIKKGFLLCDLKIGGKRSILERVDYSAEGVFPNEKNWFESKP